MTYQETIDYLDAIHSLGSKPGLERIQQLLQLVGNPERELAVVHITGTNGKGSTAAFIMRMLSESGLKVGLFSSPPLERMEDMIRINGIPVDEGHFSKCAGWIRDAAEKMQENGYEQPTQFECMTGIALLAFQLLEVQIAIVEVGMGGALDSTNVFDAPLVSVITPVSLDHQGVLGDTLEAIAQQKIGIIKPNAVTVTSVQDERVLEMIATCCAKQNNRLVIAPTEYVSVSRLDERGSQFELFEHSYEITMIGMHQVQNAVLAITVIGVLRETYGYMIEEGAMLSGLFKTAWPGRLELLCKKPIVLLDGAHNPHGMQALTSTFHSVFPNRRIIGVMGVLKDKDYRTMVAELAPFLSDLIATEPDNERRLPATTLAETAMSFGKMATVEPDIKEALDKALQLAKDDDIIIICGSLYLLSMVRRILSSILM